MIANKTNIKTIKWLVLILIFNCVLTFSSAQENREKEFKNRGLSYCATCDAPLFSEKEVAVIGGGNSALDAVLQLVNIAKHVFLINNTPELGGDEVMREKVAENKKVSIFNNSRINLHC